VRICNGMIRLKMKEYSIKKCGWNSDKQQLSDIRREVFINEQQVPEELEWDEFDQSAQHVIALNQAGQPIATGRIKTDGHIGRMSVLKEYRQQGIGSAILLVLLDNAHQQNLKRVYLHAQVNAVPFYEKHGFIVQGKEFVDAGIAHKTMYKNLSEK